MTEPMQEEQPYFSQQWDKLINVTKDKWRRRIVKTDPHIASPEERRVFYELIWRIAWLAPRIRRALAKELRISPQEYKFFHNQQQADIARFRIKAHVDRMKQNGLSYDARREAALSMVAKEDGITVAAVRKRLERNPTVRKEDYPSSPYRSMKGRQK
jgi:hypothetical protein